MLSRPGVQKATVDMCAYGLVTRGDKGGDSEPARKTTSVMTNSPCMLSNLNRRCPGIHRHRHLLGGRAELAAKSPQE